MIAILLCTYNGEKYLPKQLESLLSQSYQNFKIFIHDDGSTDSTNNIVQHYQQIYPEKIQILGKSIKGYGAKKSFMWLLEKVDAEYYMFCDQDDIWLETKIEDSYDRMLEVESKHPQKPIVIHTDLTLINEKEKIIHQSFWDYANIKVDISKQFKFLCFRNIVTGCTMIINKKAKQVSFPDNDIVKFHDYWIALRTAKFGIVENLKKQTILYRQHENNVAGCGEKHEKYNYLPKTTLHKWILSYKKNKDFYNAIDYGSFIKLTWNKIVYYILIRL